MASGSGKGDIDLKLTAKDLMSPILAQAGQSIQKLVQQSEVLNKVTSKIGSTTAFKSMQGQFEKAAKTFQTVKDSPSGGFSKWVQNANRLQTSALRGTDETIQRVVFNANSIIAASGIISTLKIFSGFEDAIADLRAVMPDLTKNQFGDLKEKIIELGDALPYTSGEVAGVTKALARSGMGFSQIMDSMEPMLKLDVAAGTKDPANVALTMQQALETFGMAAEESGLLADKMLTVSRLTGTTPLDFQQSLAGVGAQSKEQGLNSDETLATLGILTKYFKDPNLAKTQFKALIRSLLNLQERAKTSGQYSKVAPIFDKSGKLPSVLKAIEYLASKNADFFQIFDEEGKEAALYLKQNMEKVAQIQMALGPDANGISKSRGEVDRQYAERSQTLSKKLDQLNGAMEKLAIKLSEDGGLADIAKDKIDAVSKFVEEINKTDPENMRKAVDSVETLAKIMAAIAALNFASTGARNIKAAIMAMGVPASFFGAAGAGVAGFAAITGGDTSDRQREWMRWRSRRAELQMPGKFENFARASEAAAQIPQNQSRVQLEITSSENMSVKVKESDPLIDVMMRGYNLK